MNKSNNRRFGGRPKGNYKSKSSGNGGNARQKNGNASGNSNASKQGYKFCMSSENKNQKYKPFAAVRAHFIGMISKDQKLQLVAKAMEDEQPWDAQSEEPRRRVSTIDIFVRETHYESVPVLEAGEAATVRERIGRRAVTRQGSARQATGRQAAAQAAATAAEGAAAGGDNTTQEQEVATLHATRLVERTREVKDPRKEFEFQQHKT